MSVKDHRRVIDRNSPMLIERLSNNLGAYNKILDSLKGKQVIPNDTYNDLEMKQTWNLSKRAARVRAFLRWLRSSIEPKVFLDFYEALRQHELQTELKALLSHELFKDAEMFHVSTLTCSSVHKVHVYLNYDYFISKTPL